MCVTWIIKLNFELKKVIEHQSPNERKLNEPLKYNYKI